MPVFLTKLTLEGFKSFAEPTDITFDVPIVAVVGPNGSGKSNIAEAIRFALGEQSMRALRSGRGEDVIFHGSPGRPRINRARVELTVDNMQRVLPIDFDEVRIARTVVRDGQQTYEINGSRVRLRDVQELLAHINIGPSSYHIISQGEADRLLTLSPTELRAAIEDALGLRFYHTRRAQALQKIASAKEALLEARARQAELTPRVAALERQVAKVRKGQELARSLKESWREYSAAFWGWYRSAQQALEEEQARLAQELTVAREGASALAGTVDPSHQLHQAREALARAQEELARAREMSRTLGEQLARAEGALDALQEEHRNPEQPSPATFTLPKEGVATLQNMLHRAHQALHAGQYDEAKALVTRALTTFDALLASQEESHSTKDSGEEGGRARRMALLKEEVDRLRHALQHAHEEEANAQARLKEAERQYDQAQGALREYERAQYAAREAQHAYELAQRSLAQRREALTRMRELWEEDAREVALLVRDASCVEPVEGDGDAVAWSEEELQRRRKEIERMKLRLEELAHLPAQEIEREYEEAKGRLDALSRDITDLEETLANLEAMVREIDAELSRRFAAGIEEVSRSFSAMVQTVFGQGSGRLEVVVASSAAASHQKDEEASQRDDAPSSLAATGRLGVVVHVTLPKKRVTHLGMLSGGERSLVAAALIFALSRISPPPFLVLDEMDAALDEANSRRLGVLLEDLAHSTQLILITHNRETMRHAQRLYGVAMGSDGVSRLLSVRLEDAQQA